MATTSHIDYRKIDYDQLIDKPINRVASNVDMDTLTTAGVYDKGDGKRIIVNVDGNNITQTIEEKNGYQERVSTNGWTTWGNRDVVVFNEGSDKWDKVIISQNEPVAPVETTAWLNITDDSFNIYDGTEWHTIAGGGTTEVPYIPTFSGVMNGTTTTFTNSNIEAWDGIILVGTTSWHPAGLWEYNVSVWGFTINSTESEDHVAFKYLIVKSHGIAVIEQADEIEYDNTESWLTSDNVQDALDELAELASHGSQVDTIPAASSENEGKIVQYVWDTNQYYTNAYFYKCIEDPENPGQYIWQEIPVSDNSAENISYDNVNSWMSSTNVQDAIDEVQGSITTINTTLEEIQNIVEVTTMEEASAENEGNIIQYKGASTASFTQGYFYKCVEVAGSDPAEYTWERIDVQPDNSWESIEYVTQAEYDLLTPAEKADATKHYAVYEEWSIPHVQAEDVDYDNTNSWMSSTNVQDAIDEAVQFDNITIMPAPVAELEGKILQYKGTTNPFYTHGYFYECVADGAGYKWENVQVWEGGSWDGIVNVTTGTNQVITWIWAGTQTQYDNLATIDNTVMYVITPPDYSNLQNITLAYTEGSASAFEHTYSEDATGLSSGSEYFDAFFGYKPVLLDTNGNETAELNPNDFTKDVNGNDVNITSGDNVMIKFPIRWYKVSKVGNVITLSMTKDVNRESEGYVYRPFCRGTYDNPIKKDCFYIGAYEFYNNSWVGKSWSGKEPTCSQTHAQFMAQARANDGNTGDEGYEYEGRHQRDYINLLYMMKYCNGDSQATFGQGISSGSKHNTGETNTSWMNYGTQSTTTAIKLFGIENYWGNCTEYVWGCMSDGNLHFLTALSNFTADLSNPDWQYVDTGIVVPSNSSWRQGWSKAAGNSKWIFVPVEANGTQYNDRFYGVASRLLRVSDDWDSGSHAGAFHFRLDDTASYSHSADASRLMYL